MTVYEQELRKLFEHSNLVDRPQFSGRVCVGDLGKDLRVRAEFLSTHISSQYDAIRLGAQPHGWRGGPDAAALSGCLG